MLDRLDAPDAPGIVVLASSPADPLNYGRIIPGQGDRIAKMVEYKDATDEERAVRLCNSGMMAVRAARPVPLAGAGRQRQCGGRILSARHRHRRGRRRRVRPWSSRATRTRPRASTAAPSSPTSKLEWQRRRREQALDEGATLIDPESVWFAFDTKLGRDVTVEPHVVFGPGVEIADGAVDPRLQPHRGRDHRPEGEHRPLRPHSPRHPAVREHQGRQFRRAQEGRGRGGRQGQPSVLRRRRVGRREGQHRRGHDHLQLRRLPQISDRRSAPAPSSARTRRSSPR